MSTIDVQPLFGSTAVSFLPEYGGTASAIRTALGEADGAIALLAENELLASAAARRLAPPDHSAAFFHAYRAVEGYLEDMILRPVARALLIPADPTWSDFAPRDVFQRSFRERVLRQALWIASGLTAVDTVQTFFRNFLSVRHRTMHGFYQPSEDEARRCLQSAREIIGMLEKARATMREENNGI